MHNSGPIQIRGARVVVTGGAGFIGSHLAAALVARGAEQVTIVDSLRYGDLANLGREPRIRLVKHEIGFDDPLQLADALVGASALFHLAAEKHNQSKDSPAKVVSSNISGTLSLYELAVRAGIKKILFSSSLYAYGRTTAPAMHEDERCTPNTVYGISKLAGEHLLSYIGATHGIDTMALRYFFVYGPKQFAGMGYKSVIMKSFERLAAGQAPVVFGDGEQALDYVFVDDVVDATIRAMELPGSGHLLNIASGRSITVNQLIATLCACAGSNVNPEGAPADWTAGTVRVGDPTRARDVLGWQAETSLDAGLARTFQWLQESQQQQDAP